MRGLLNSLSVIALTAATATATAAAAQGTPSANSEEVFGLEEVVVTASRREETVQRAALSVQALSSDTLERANVTKPEDLNAIAPGLSIGTGGNSPQVYIRGVGNFASNALAEGAVAFNLDGVYISRPPSVRGMFYDLERVEVLKGPQGTLYGRNATGGAINVITRRPQLGQTSGYMEFQAGNYNLARGTAAVNVPLGETAAIRAATQIVRRDGYLTDGYDDEKGDSARIQFLWEPNDAVSLLINTNYQHAFGNGTGGVLKPQLPGDSFRGSADPAVTRIFQAQPGIGPLLTYPKTDGYMDIETYAVGAELTWDLDFATLTLLPAYRYSEIRDLSYVPGFSVIHADEVGQTSFEARLGDSGDKLKWVVGAYYFDEQQNEPDGEAELITYQGLSTFILSDHDLNTRSYAAFGQATYGLTDRFRVTGGLRYTYEKKELAEFLSNYSLTAQPPLPPGTCASGVFDPRTPTPPLFCRLDIDTRGARAQELTYNSVTYKAGVEYDVAEQSMAYATLSTGFKSGGFSSMPPPNTFRPEKLTALDMGVKNRFLDNRLQINVEAFYWKYKDHQETSVGPTTVPGFFALQTYNAGQAKSYGADLDVVFRATSQDELSLKVQYNKTEYDSFSYFNQTSRLGPPTTGCLVGPVLANGSQLVNCAGKPLMRAPLWTGTARYSHDFDLGSHGQLTASFDAQFSSSYYLSTDFLEAGRQDSFAVGNFNLTYTTEDEQFVLSAFVNNIWDEAVYTQGFHYPYVNATNPLSHRDGIILGTLRPPRTMGASLKISF